MSIFLSCHAFSQVGIQNSNPQATLDIFSKGVDGSTKALKINNGSSPSREMVTVLDNGNVGVGIPNPDASLTVGAANGSFPGYMKLNPQNTEREGGQIDIMGSPVGSTKNWSIDQFSWPGISPTFRIFYSNKSTGAADGRQFSISENDNVGINEINPQDLLHLYGTPGGFGPVGGIYLTNPQDGSWARLGQGHIQLNRVTPFAGHVGGYIDFNGGYEGGGSSFRIAKTALSSGLNALAVTINNVSTDINALPLYIHSDGRVGVGTSQKFTAAANISVRGQAAAEGWSVRHGTNGFFTGNSFNISWDGVHAGVYIDGTFFR
ncbi:hypothetical protein HNP38_002694 [Chryseobacterium defluvii]|uniref:Uncharacterized protein n=1 Tax=Chryseobacterium defluvii TaxID=160396 RepID=A0A840KIR7_9FLAO|nr:hypothetical protein [Chryseobacterium defluvii]MBB4807390.1 hypothetical protein [Chryseobacterium defluvii]